jgi:hypothetical protein
MGQFRRNSENISRHKLIFGVMTKRTSVLTRGENMNHDFSSLKRGHPVTVRVRFDVGFNGYWYLAGTVRRKHTNRYLTVDYEDLSGKQVSVKYNSEGYPIGPNGTVERRYDGGMLVPTTDAIRRIFKHQQALSSIWHLTWPDLLLLQDYELDFINALLQEARLRGQARRKDQNGAQETQSSLN